MASQQINIAVW